jgi:hypothetical protein
MNNQTVQLPYYGIHEDSTGISYLFQDICPYGWEFLGLKDKRSNLSVKHLKNRCPHQINVYIAQRVLSNKIWNSFLRIVNDPLVQAMLPLPNGKTYHFDQRSINNPTEWFSCLERLSSPLHTAVKPFWAETNQMVSKKLELTNIQPLVMMDLNAGDALAARRFSDLNKTCPRTLILSCTEPLVLPKSVQSLSGSRLEELISLKDLISLPLEHIGSYLVGEHCKGSLNLESYSN